MAEVLSTERLTKRYRNSRALDEVTFSMPEGAIYGLVGANGAGKTTLLKTLMNVISPTAGRAQVLGMDSRAIGGKSFERIGYVSENQELPEGMTVGSMLHYVKVFYPEWDTELEARLVRQFDLPLDRKLKHLSRGMRMKAAFASSLAYRPKVLVLDEPFSGLDPLVRDELIAGLLDQAGETTVLLSSHDLAEIESFASHIGYLEQGRMLFSDEMGVLKERFREVTVTLAAPGAIPVTVPRGWMQMETVNSVVRFVHSEFAGEASVAEIGAVYEGAEQIVCESMPLRDIFLAIARAGRDARREASGSTGGKAGA